MLNGTYINLASKRNSGGNARREMFFKRRLEQLGY
jgi:hypothetical protein